MDVKGAQALKERIDATPDDDSRPDVRVLTNSVGFLVQRQNPDHARYDVKAMGQIDQHGHIGLTPSLPWGGHEDDLRERMTERRAEMAEALCDDGLAEWRNIGSGDTELYATPALLEHVAPALAALPRDWQRWPR